ncbi:MAG: hypothetical protein IT472_08805 [Thermomonas sp.]|uniref:hypothetical protein n=1 Tax=Thermomonas sp. TaxID=1971895 RepID=UPI002632F585|nr:hypothetical protein [Thermomonas sp.]MCC7097264.1 hypothetical protein [Thermomonas sp.]
MVDYVDAGELVRRIRAYAFGGHAPEDVADRLQTLPGVPADVICAAGELLYAHFDLLDDSGWMLVAEIYQHTIQQGWSGFNQGDRSAVILAQLSAVIADDHTDPDAWPAPHTGLRDGLDWRGPQADMPIDAVTAAD